MKFITYHSQTTVYISDEHFSVERTGTDSSIVLSVSGFSDSVTLFGDQRIVQAEHLQTHCGLNHNRNTEVYHGIV